MLFLDDEAKAQYQLASEFQKMLAQMFESVIFQLGYECEIIEFDLAESKFTFGCPQIGNYPQLSIDFCKQFNKQFKRKDNGYTCAPHDLRHGIFFLLATHPSDILMH